MDTVNHFLLTKLATSAESIKIISKRFAAMDAGREALAVEMAELISVYQMLVTRNVTPNWCINDVELARARILSQMRLEETLGLLPEGSSHSCPAGDALVQAVPVER